MADDVWRCERVEAEEAVRTRLQHVEQLTRQLLEDHRTDRVAAYLLRKKE